MKCGTGNIQPDDFERERLMKRERLMANLGNYVEKRARENNQSSEDWYLNYMWEKMIAKDRPDLTPKDDEYKALKAQTYKAWKEHWHETQEKDSDAVKWVEKMAKIPVAKWDKDLEWMVTDKAEPIFSNVGATFVNLICVRLGIKYESLTIERKLAATTAIKDYTSIIAWIASNATKIEQEEPYGTE